MAAQVIAAIKSRLKFVSDPFLSPVGCRHFLQFRWLYPADFPYLRGRHRRDSPGQKLSSPPTEVIIGPSTKRGSHQIGVSKISGLTPSPMARESPNSFTPGGGEEAGDEVPPVTAAVQAIVPVPFPLSVNVTPFGRAPASVSDGAGVGNPSWLP